MIRAGLIKTIVTKELRETLRDRRTLLIMVGLPVILYPLLMLSFSSTQAARIKARQAKTSTVIVWGEFGRTPRINQSAGRDHWPRAPPSVLRRSRDWSRCPELHRFPDPGTA